MISSDKLYEFKFNASELVSILTEEVAKLRKIDMINFKFQKFNYHRAAVWMDDHVALSIQVI